MACSPPGSSVHGDSPSKSIGVGCHALLQGIFPTQASNSGLLHCKWILYCLSYQESPRILKWVVYPFSRESSWLRNWTGVSCIAGRFFTSWTNREAKTHWTKVFICLLYLYKDDKLILILKELRQLEKIDWRQTQCKAAVLRAMCSVLRGAQGRSSLLCFRKAGLHRSAKHNTSRWSMRSNAGHHDNPSHGTDLVTACLSHLTAQNSGFLLFWDFLRFGTQHHPWVWSCVRLMTQRLSDGIYMLVCFRGEGIQRAHHLMGPNPWSQPGSKVYLRPPWAETDLQPLFNWSLSLANEKFQRHRQNITMCKRSFITGYFFCWNGYVIFSW